MKCMIVLSALVALSSAGVVAPIAPLAYTAAYNPALTFGYSSVAASPYYANTVYAAPSVSHVVQTPAVYSAAPVVATRTVVAAPAPVVPATHAVVAAPAPVVAAAPAVVATRTVVAAPAPVVAAPAVIAATPALAGVKTQYHAQDELGQASYGHSEPTQAHNAVQDAFGNKVGSFSYVAPDGKVVRTDYVADALGYRVNSNALPVGPGPVADTAEVVAARAAHLALHARAKRSLVAVGHTPASTAPLATAVVAAPVAAPLAYSAAPLAYSAAPLAYSAAPLAYSAHLAAPLAYSAPAVASAPLAYSTAAVAAAPLVREATLTTVVNNPGHAVSYRVD